MYNIYIFKALNVQKDRRTKFLELFKLESLITKQTKNPSDRWMLNSKWLSI